MACGPGPCKCDSPTCACRRLRMRTAPALRNNLAALEQRLEPIEYRALDLLRKYENPGLATQLKTSTRQRPP